MVQFRANLFLLEAIACIWTAAPAMSQGNWTCLEESTTCPRLASVTKDRGTISGFDFPVSKHFIIAQLGRPNNNTFLSHACAHRLLTTNHYQNTNHCIDDIHTLTSLCTQINFFKSILKTLYVFIKFRVTNSIKQYLIFLFKMNVSSDML